jgi:CRISPR-associated protein Cas2
MVLVRNSRANSQTGCYVIAYDIPNDKRRTKVHKILLGYGKWTQYSLFECFLSRKDLRQLQAKLEQHLVEAEESVRFYPLCAVCVRKGETVGGLPPAEDILFVI